MEQHNTNKPVPLEGQTGNLSVRNYEEIIATLPLEQRMAFDRERAEREAELAATYPHLSAKLHQAKKSKRGSSTRRRQRGRQVPTVRTKYLAKLQHAYVHVLQAMKWAAGTLKQGCIKISKMMTRIISTVSVATGAVYRLAQHHILSPLLCFVCILVGVCLSALLPASLWIGIALPSIAQWGKPTLLSFPLTQIPELATWFVILLVSLPIAVVVFREGAFTAWRSSTEPLLARMLYMVAAGIRWPKVWFLRRQVPPSSPTTP